MYRRIVRRTFVLVPLLGMACGDTQAPVGGASVQLSFTLVFPGPGAAVVPFESARVRVSDAGGATLADTTVGATGGGAPVNVTVPLPGGDGSYTLQVDLLDASGATVFAGQPTTATLTAGGTAQVDITLSYVGPGATATTIAITSTDSILPGGDSVLLQATAMDASSSPVAAAPIYWSTDNPARAAFADPTIGWVLAGTQTGVTNVIAQLASGPADTLQLNVLPSISTQMAEAIDSLETAVAAAHAITGSSGLDGLSFTRARQLFEAVLALEPDNEPATFGAAVAMLGELEGDPAVRAVLDAWDAWNGTGQDLESVFKGAGPFPPTVAAQQIALRDVVLPVLQAVLPLIASIDDPAFAFPFTQAMQGPDLDTGLDLEIDLTDVTALQSGLELAIGAIEVALAYQGTPSPYGPAGVDAAMAIASTFGTLAADGAARLSRARTNFQTAVTLLGDALALLKAETDAQNDDVFKYSNGLAGGQWDQLEDTLGVTDVADMQSVLTDFAGILAGPEPITVSEVGRMGLTNLIIDGAQFFTSPIANLKTLLPAYTTQAGRLRWDAVAFDQWVIPDPTLNGVLPGIPDTDSLDVLFDLVGLWADADWNFDRWVGAALAPTGTDVFFLDEAGQLLETASDVTGQTDRPAATPPVGQLMSSLIKNTVTLELTAASWDQIFTRPDDAATGWTMRATSLSCCELYLAESPAGNGTVWFISPAGELWEAASDFSTVSDRPDVFGSVAALAGNAGTGDLVTVSYDGAVFARPADAATAWAQVAQLPFQDFDARWISLVQDPAASSVWVIARNGELRELAGDYSTVSIRPRLPVSDVRVLAAHPGTGELIAVTESGRVFTRPADGATDWTQRATLPILLRL